MISFFPSLFTSPMQTPSETKVDVNIVFLNLGGFAAENKRPKTEKINKIKLRIGIYRAKNRAAENSAAL
jgi:hypothetical protein